MTFRFNVIKFHCLINSCPLSYSYARYSLFVLKVPLNSNQPTYLPTACARLPPHCRHSSVIVSALTITRMDDIEAAKVSPWTDRCGGSKMALSYYFGLYNSLYYGTSRDFRQKSPFISKTVRGRPAHGCYRSLIGSGRESE